jgi:hypothetical protein
MARLGTRSQEAFALRCLSSLARPMAALTSVVIQSGYERLAMVIRVKSKSRVGEGCRGR